MSFLRKKSMKWLFTTINKPCNKPMTLLFDSLCYQTKPSAIFVWSYMKMRLRNVMRHSNWMVTTWKSYSEKQKHLPGCFCLKKVRKYYRTWTWKKLREKLKIITGSKTSWKEKIINLREMKNDSFPTSFCKITRRKSRSKSPMVWVGAFLPQKISNMAKSLSSKRPLSVSNTSKTSPTPSLNTPSLKKTWRTRCTANISSRAKLQNGWAISMMARKTRNYQKLRLLSKIRIKITKYQKSRWKTC